jgi:pimeloyl-ACP methyl ester carboxylesterase
MESIFITTRLGRIAVYIKEGSQDKTPVILLHGVYFDHNLWKHQTDDINDRKVITIDMPYHGESKSGIPDYWTLEDCGDMLVEILDSLQITKVISVGHSWGSMTILRATHKHPERFRSVGFCNMPFKPISNKQRRLFKFQHKALLFKDFYRKQAAQALFSKRSLNQNPELLQILIHSMKKLTNREIKLTDTYVILKARDATHMISNLQVPALALKGREDYVPSPPEINTKLVNGGHVSPLEVPEEVSNFIHQVIHISR